MKNKIFSLFLALVMSAGMIDAAQFTIDGIQYNTLSGATGAVEVYKSYSSNDTVIIPDTVSYLDVQYHVTGVRESAFYNNPSLRYVSLPTSVTTIGKKAFQDCTNLQSVVLPDSLPAIPEALFRGCTSLQRVNMPEGVTSIGINAFRGTQLKSIVIPSSVQSIGDYALRECSLLTTLTVQAMTPPTLGTYVFRDAPLRDIYVPCGTLEAYKSAWSDFSNMIAYVPYDEPIVIESQELGYVKIPSSPCEPQELLAVAYSGSHFVRWSDGVTANPRSYVYPEEIAYTAEFSADRLFLWGGMTTDTILMLTVYNDIVESDLAELLSTTLPGATYTIQNFHTARWGWEAAVEISQGGTTTQHTVHIAHSQHYNYGSVRATITGENKATATTYNVAKSGEGSLYEDAFVSACNNGKNTITDSLGYVGYKLQTSGTYLAITLTYETFNAGDILNIYTTQNTSFPDAYYRETDSCLHVYTDAGITPLVTIPDNPQPGLHSVVLGQAADGAKSIYLYRTKNDMNPYVAYMEVLRGFHYTYTVACDPEQGYAIHPTGSTNYLGETSIEVVANYGYHFTQWSDGVTDNPRQILIYSDTTFMAEFARNSYTVTTASAEPEWGTTAGDTTALYRDSVTITATANYGYHFVQWLDEKEEIIPEDPIEVTPVISVAEAYDLASGLSHGQISSQKYTVAGYIVGVFTSGVRSYYMSDSPDGVGQFVIYRINTTANVGDFVYITGYLHNYNGIYETYSGAELSYTAPEVHDEKIPVYADTTTLRQVQVVSDTTYTAHFAKNIYTITKHDDSVMGHIEGLSRAEYLDEVTLTAVANHGYHFTQWSDGVTDNPRAFILTQDAAFRAEFAQTFSGQCGEALYWAYANHSLSFTGSGDMYRYGSNDVPWLLLADSIQHIEFASAMTSISNYAFANVHAISKINLPAEINRIGDYAFANCSGVNVISIPNSVQQLGAGAFYGCSGADTLVIGIGISQISNQFRGCSNLRYLQLSQSTQLVDHGAFYDAHSLNDIVCHAQLPPTAYPDEVGNERSFYNTNARVLIPCDYFKDYEVDALWGSFKLRCLSSDNTTAVEGEVTVVPGDANAMFTWPVNGSAETYTLEITKDGIVFCTLVFDAEGRLKGIAFAPGANGNSHSRRAAALTTNGMEFLVTGLDYASAYNFSFITRDNSQSALFAYNGAFQTNGALQGVEEVEASSATQKILINGQFFIIRDNKTYTIIGQRVE